MKILALDLSTARGSLAWLDGGVDLAHEWANDRKHSGLFFENLESSRKKFGAPERIIVGLGPGSYAGIRIAISAAIGLRESAKSELMGWPSICAIEDGEYCVIGDARRESFYFACVRSNDLVEGPTLFNETELKARLDKLNMPIFCSETLPQFERAVVRYPSATVLARLASASNHRFVLPPLEPIYLREPHITVPK
jgi:tRNA threonylcarbamoyladenosine biosynthesis protein TsaB